MDIKTKRKCVKIFICVIIMTVVIGSLSAFAVDRPASYGFCQNEFLPFTSNYYNCYFTCWKIDSDLSLTDGNNAKTSLLSSPSPLTYKEAYVAIWNSKGTIKSDSSCNSMASTAYAEVNPIAFTPVKAHHEILVCEHEGTDGYKMHSRIYR
ncbi:MAG: hypothetical protein GX851_04565 [Clostridiales bacterium]|nr:hypothetical protein [Clostridiales bacterium]